jgi:hypothetical protein
MMNATDHSRAHQKNQPTSKHRGKKKVFVFFIFAGFFISSNYFARQSNQNMKTLSTQSHSVTGPIIRSIHHERCQPTRMEDNRDAASIKIDQPPF